MKKIALLTISFLLTSLLVFAQSSSLPNTAIKNSAGKEVKFNTLFKPGTVTVVSFWNRPCIPCRQELDAVTKKIGGWKTELGEKKDKFNYIIISIDDVRSTNQAKNMVKSQKWPFDNYYDVNSDLKRSLNFQEVPFTIVIDKNGKIAYRHPAYKPGSEDILFKKVKEMLNK